MNHILRRFFSINSPKLANLKNVPFAQEIQLFLRDHRKINAREWGELRAKLLQSSTNQTRLDNIILTHFAMMQSKCQSLIYTKEYLKALPALNVEPTLTNYDYLVRSFCCKSVEERLTREEQAELLETCEILIRKSEMCLPFEILKNVVQGLCHTDQWKRSLSILNEMGECARFAKNTVVKKAFSEGEVDLGFQLLDETVTDGYEIDPEVCTAYWNFCRERVECITENIERMLRYLESKEVVLSKTCMRELHAVLDEFGLSGNFAYVDKRGKCDSCRSTLKRQGISAEEYERLKGAIMDIALIGDNEFLKTTPDEVERFTKFIDETAPYDLVLDGLNVAFRTHARPTVNEKAETLASVVMHFAKREQRILLIGREHMNKWPPKPMNYIRRNSIFFPVHNESYDDLFTLYAALFSGPNTRILTCDLMRSHSFLLGSELKSIFKRWQQTNHLHNLIVNRNGNISYSQPIEHKMCCHKTNSHWHVPYVNDDDFKIQMAERTKIEKMQWSCIKLVS